MAELRGPSRFKLSRQDATQQDVLPAGRRVTLDVDATMSRSSGAVTGDILERPVQAPSAMSTHPVRPRDSPKPRKIDWRARSAARQAQSSATATRNDRNMQEPGDATTLAGEIERENAAKVAGMSEATLKQEQKDLMAQLDPGVVAALRRRAAIKEEKRRQESVVHEGEDDDVGEVYEEQFVRKVPTIGTARSPKASDTKANNMEEIRQAREENLPSPASNGHTSTHFPARALDPDSETFLQDLKENYFPNLSHDPSKLQWMQPPTDAEDTAQYHPATSDAVAPGEIRFGFRGELLAPLASREVDAALGLHHHADAPRAAGYTILELALLARSTQPSQASLAIRTLGRVLYRLHRGTFGAAITQGLLQVVKEARVMETLLERSRDTHLSVANYATEALWQANLDKPAEVMHAD